MELQEYPLLHEPDLMLTVLRVGLHEAGSLDDCVQHLCALLELAKERPPAALVELRERLVAARAKLARAGLVEEEDEGRFRTTPRGRKVLAEHPDGVDETLLMQFEAFRTTLGRPSRADQAPERFSPEYESGYAAFLAGRQLADNPHPADSCTFLKWANGWSQARDDAPEPRIAITP
ncbi:MAG: hypothetical protein ACREH3_10680 [Geminicoccales bacterium]